MKFYKTKFICENVSHIKFVHDTNVQQSHFESNKFWSTEYAYSRVPQRAEIYFCLELNWNMVCNLTFFQFFQEFCIGHFLTIYICIDL